METQLSVTIMFRSDEFAEFSNIGLAFETSLFIASDVDADGNCFYHAIVASGVLPAPTATNLRIDLVRRIRQLYLSPVWSVVINDILRKYQVRCGFFPYLQQLLQNGVWASDMEMIFIYVVYGVNIVSISNQPCGLSPFNARRVLSDILHIQLPANEFVDSNQCIHLYHHYCGRPMTPTHAGNHYCVLFEVADENQKAALWTKAYRGGVIRFSPSVAKPANEKDVLVKKQGAAEVSKGVKRAVPNSEEDNPTEGGTKKGNDKSSGETKTKAPSAKSEAAAVSKAKKQKTLLEWLPKVAPATKQQILEMEMTKRVQSKAALVGADIVSERIMTKGEKDFDSVLDDKDDDDATVGSSGSTGGCAMKCLKLHVTSEISWPAKALHIYFHLHPLLGNGSFDVTCALFRVKEITVRNWLKKPERIQKWITLVENLTFEDVLKTLPKKVRAAYMAILTPPYPKIDVTTYRKKISSFKCPTVFLHKKGAAPSKGRAMALFAKKNPTKAIYIRSDSKRIMTAPTTRLAKHHEVKKFVKSVIEERWLQGLPITKQELSNLTVKVFGNRKDAASVEFMGTYGQTKKAQSMSKMNVFLGRAIEEAGYSGRKYSISQKIPVGWKDLALEGARRVRETFLRENVNVVIAADEMFIRFHEEGSSVLAPTGEKRIGKSVTCDKKAGCTVLPTMDLLSSCLLPPMIIFNGVFGGRLMKQWSQHTESFVLFTEKHWMTTETMVLYLKKMMTFYKGRTIGLIIDKAPSHTNETVYNWVKRLNDEDQTKTRIVLEWVDGGLTSVYQPGDIAVNKDLRNFVRKEYQGYIASNAKAFKPGETVKVSRERLVGFIENAFNEFNEGQRLRRGVAKAFETCGLNPWADDDEEFQKHLAKLDENYAYKNCSLRVGEAMSLEQKK
jgi:hypothetical protein